MTISIDKVGANPTKAFFVTMITRDIALEDCILDLIDNSVDGAWRSEGSRPMGLADGADLSKYSITIEATPSRFMVRDNCGGMTLDDAVNHAFSFGRQESAQQDAYSIGVYGIGMKRAVFKLGRDIKVRSTYSYSAEKREAFVVPINVDNWLANDTPPWDFDIDDADPLEHNGVEIVVQSLNPSVATSFDNPVFVQNLRRIIARDYSLHLSRGLRISLNGSEITGALMQLRLGEDFAPMRIQYTDQVDGRDVSVEIICGMAAPPPEDASPDAADTGERRFGWYVVCNGRIVLAADKTVVSGWGTDGWPQWHRQYSGFMGIVLFTAADARVLPLTTTKRSVDTSSEVYRRSQPKMREVTRSWIGYTNDRREAMDDAKRKEAAAKPIAIQAVASRPAISVPKLVARPIGEPVANVHYSVPVAKLTRLAKGFGSIRLSYREVGLKSFEYAYSDLAEKD
jgi:hypothetical protein